MYRRDYLFMYIIYAGVYPIQDQSKIKYNTLSIMYVCITRIWKSNER